VTADTSLEQQIPFCARSAPPWRRRAPTQQPARRVRHPEPLRRRGQRCRRHLRVVDPPRPTGTLPVLQRAQPALRVAIPPVDHRRARQSDPGSAIAVFEWPSPASSTIRARCTVPPESPRPVSRTAASTCRCRGPPDEQQSACATVPARHCKVTYDTRLGMVASARCEDVEVGERRVVGLVAGRGRVPVRDGLDE